MTATTATPATDLEVREFQVREVAADRREFTGIAVPWGQVANIAGVYMEEFERGAVEDSDDAKTFWRHHEPIGKVIAARDVDAGWEIDVALSDTERGREAYTLLRDGVVTNLSVGFEPIEHRETVAEDGSVTITRTRVRVREVSLTPFPAYDGAAVTQVRHAQPGTDKKEKPMPPTATVTEADLTEVREEIAVLGRAVSTLAAAAPTPEPEVHYRSAGALLKALAQGDEIARREYEDTLKRAYAGGTTADTVTRKGWVGDLTRIVDEAPGIRGMFATGPLPAEGNFLEYGVLDANTIEVDEQAAEGDDLTFGKVSITTATAPVKTFGGYTTLTRQEIERSSVAVLDHSLRALDIAANRHLNGTFRTHNATAVAAQLAAGNKVTVADGDAFTAWVGAIIDAAVKYEDLGLPIDALVAGPAVFKRIAALEDSAGRPLMVVSGEGVNAVGRIDAKALNGQLAGVDVRLNAKGTGAAFHNREAIRTFLSPLSRLQDENVVNLSKSFSLYAYGALATEIPAAIVAVEITV